MPATESKPTEIKSPPKLRAAQPLAADDLRIGDGVTVGQATAQMFADADPPPGDDNLRLLRTRYIPEVAGRPLKVEAICLPFVLARDPSGDRLILDLRRHHLLRLDHRYTRRAFKALKPKKKRGKSS